MPKAAINNFRILAIGLLTLALDQITKWIVVQKSPGRLMAPMRQL